MTRRTIDNVIPELDEWQSKYGDFMYTVKAFFTNKEFLRATKKDRDSALELQGLLMESAQTPQDFILESDGTSKAGNPKWKLVAFGPLDQDAWTYSTLKEPRSNGGGSVSSDAETPGGTAPHRGSTPRASTDASIRASVALKAAANAFGTVEEILTAADIFDEWLLKKSGGTALPDQGGGVGEVASGEGPAPSSTTEGKWQERAAGWGPLE